MELILNPEDVTIPPNDRTIISKIFAENAVTGILQPSEPLSEKNDITFCAAIITLDEGTTRINVNNFTDSPYKLKGDAHSQLFSNDARADETRQANRPSVHLLPTQ